MANRLTLDCTNCASTLPNSVPTITVPPDKPIGVNDHFHIGYNGLEIVCSNGHRFRLVGDIIATRVA